MYYMPVAHLYCQMLSARCCYVAVEAEAVGETVEGRGHTKAVETMVEQDHSTCYVVGLANWDTATHDLLGLVQLCLWACVLCSSVL